MPHHFEVMMTEVGASHAGSVVATVTCDASRGIAATVAVATATIAARSSATAVTTDVRFQGGKSGIDRTLIAALKRLNEARQVACDVAGEH